MPHIMCYKILRQLESRVRTVCAGIRCPVKTQLLKQIIQPDQHSDLFCKLFN